MKASVILSLLTLVAASYAFVGHTQGRLPLSTLFQSSVGKILSDLSDPARAKRQTVYDITTQDVVDCISRTTEYQCGSSGYSQRVADIALSCKNDSYARNTVNACARNENGETCGAVTLKFLSDQTNADTCSGAVASGSCSSACRSFLQYAKTMLGCCVNSYVNQTDYPLYEQYSDYLADYHLWNLCEVELPDPECEPSGLSLNFPADRQTCTLQELVSRFVEYECSANVGQSLIDELMENDRCYLFVSVMVDACSSNANGKYCAEAIGTDLLGNVATDPLIASMGSKCASDSSCDPSCRGAINDINNAYGCCVNIYNDSTIGLQLPSLSYGVWDSCGIDSPGFCETTQTLPTIQSIHTTENIQTTESIQSESEQSRSKTTEDIQSESEQSPVTTEGIQSESEQSRSKTTEDIQSESEPSPVTTEGIQSESEQSRSKTTEDTQSESEQTPQSESEQSLQTTESVQSSESIQRPHTTKIESVHSTHTTEHIQSPQATESIKDTVDNIEDTDTLSIKALGGSALSVKALGWTIISIVAVVLLVQLN